MNLINVLRTFSPALTKRSYEKRCNGFSPELMHNLIRLIMRPNHESRNHWITESIPWLYKSLCMPLEVKTRPIYPLFSLFINNNPTSDRNVDWNYDSIESEAIGVKFEKYGEVTNKPKVVKDVLMELYRSLLSTNKNQLSKLQVTEIYIDWYNGIPGVMNQLNEEDINLILDD